MSSKAEIRARMDADAKPFTRAMKRGQAALKKFDRAVLNVSNRLAKMGLATAAAAVLYLSRNAIQLGSYLSDVAHSTGFATEEFQVFRGALIEAGGKAESMEKSVLLMQKAIVQGSEGMTTYTRAFERLGLNVDELRAMKPEQQFQTIARAIAGAEDKQGALTAAIEIFGQRNAPRLIEVFKRLDKEGYGKMAADIEAAYGIMTASTQQALDRAADQIERFKNKATIKIGELIAFEGQGAAFKMLGLQFAKVASNFGFDLLGAILTAAKKGSLAVAASLHAAFSPRSFEEIYAEGLKQFPVEQNKMLQTAAKFNDKYYDEQIAKQQAKLEKSRADFAKKQAAADNLSGAVGGTGSGAGGSGSSRLADEEKIREYRLQIMRAQNEGDEKEAQALRNRIDFIQRVLKIEQETTATRAEALELAKQQIIAEKPQADSKQRGKIRTGRIGSRGIGSGSRFSDERWAQFGNPSAMAAAPADTMTARTAAQTAATTPDTPKVQLTGDALTALRAMQTELTNTTPAREA